MSEDYKTGQIYKKPMQRDMFTGNLVKSKPKAGRGDHILLKSAPGEKAAIPGMAYFAGTGPDGKRCSQCAFLADIPVWRRDCSTAAMAGYDNTREPKRVEMNACRKACELYEGRVQIGGIQYESACKYFEPKP